MGAATGGSAWLKRSGAGGMGASVERKQAASPRHGQDQRLAAQSSPRPHLAGVVVVCEAVHHRATAGRGSQPQHITASPAAVSQQLCRCSRSVQWIAKPSTPPAAVLRQPQNARCCLPQPTSPTIWPMCSHPKVPPPAAVLRQLQDVLVGKQARHDHVVVPAEHRQEAWEAEHALTTGWC